MESEHKNFYLDEAVIKALEFLKSVELPDITSLTYKGVPLVVGSGNALVVAQILFKNKPAFFATESDFESKLFDIVRTVIVISASGEKDAPRIAKKAKNCGKNVVLLTANKNAKAIKFVDKHFLFPSIQEPYSYNVSTYLSMILSYTREDPRHILNQVKTLKFPNELLEANSFVFILPDEFASIMRLFRVKMSELFGRRISYAVETFSSLKHGFTIVPSEREQFVWFKYKNEANIVPRFWQKCKEDVYMVNLPEGANEAHLITLGYSIIGKIQRHKNPDFFKHLDEYLDKIEW